MEVRANYIIVGLFTISLLLAAIFFTMWIAKQDKGVPMTQYDIHMKESVTGLSVNNDVLFTGVRVGSVTNIKISKTEPGAVVVRVSIAEDTPVREDSVATLEQRGITGVSNVSITGGTAGSPLKEVPEGQVGLINYKPSPLASVVKTIPETLTSMNDLLMRVEKVFTDENLENLRVTMDSLATVSSSVANKTRALDNILSSAEQAGTDIADLARSAKRIITGLEPDIRTFSKEGVADIRMVLLECRSLIQSLTHSARQFESNPRRFFFGDPVKEYEN